MGSIYHALAADYDGTIATDGAVAASTVAALHRARDAGVRLVLVTGRELNDLSAVFSALTLFDRVVAENGAVLFDPASRALRSLAPPPPDELIDALEARGVPIYRGRSIVATVEPHEHALLSAIHDLGLEWHVIFNKGSVMALPSGITKATGLTSALAELGVPADATVGVGDAENDHAFLEMCGLSAAVANALPALKKVVDLVTAAANGAGVCEVIERMLGT